MAESGPELRLYNSMTGRKEVFRPVVPGKVGMHVGGYAPCDYCTIGQARTYVCFDVLYRFLKHLGYEVSYLRSHNDIDDKVFERAKLLRVSPLMLNRIFSNVFVVDMDHLGCLQPTHQPYDSYHIHEIIEMIRKIIDNGYGYRSGGSVYFSVDSFTRHDCLSGQKLNDTCLGREGTISIISGKKNLADFALWKPSMDWERRWDSPWGKGRPGRHIGCSALRAHYLGLHCDIHGGSQDRIFPDHANEIALSKAAFPKSAVNFWVHNGFVNQESETMTESSNNLSTVLDMESKYHPLAIRFFLMHTHYRSEISYTDKLLEMACDQVYYIYQTLVSVEEALRPFRADIQAEWIPSGVMELVEKFQAGFLTSMLNDLQTSSVLDDLMEPLRTINNNLKNFMPHMSLIQGLAALEKVVKETLSCLGLFSSSCSSSEILKEMRAAALKRAGLSEQTVLEMIEERIQAIARKDFEIAFKIKEDLCAKGITIINGPTGTVWRPQGPWEASSTFSLEFKS